MAFAPDGNMVVSSGGDDNHSLFVWRISEVWDPSKGKMPVAMDGSGVKMEELVPVFTMGTGRSPVEAFFSWTNIN